MRACVGKPPFMIHMAKQVQEPAICQTLAPPIRLWHRPWVLGFAHQCKQMATMGQLDAWAISNAHKLLKNYPGAIKMHANCSKCEMSLHFLLLEKCNDTGEIRLLAMATYGHPFKASTLARNLPSTIGTSCDGWLVMVVRFFSVCSFGTLGIFLHGALWAVCNCDGRK